MGTHEGIERLKVLVDGQLDRLHEKENEIAKLMADNIRLRRYCVSVELMQRVWANLFYNEAEAGNTFQQTLNEVADWISAVDRGGFIERGNDQTNDCACFEPSNKVTPVGFPSVISLDDLVEEIERLHAALEEINSQSVCAVIATEGECFQMLKNCAEISCKALSPVTPAAAKVRGEK